MFAQLLTPRVMDLGKVPLYQKVATLSEIGRLMMAYPYPQLKIKSMCWHLVCSAANSDLGKVTLIPKSSDTI